MSEGIIIALATVIGGAITALFNFWGNKFSSKESRVASTEGIYTAEIRQIIEDYKKEKEELQEIVDKVKSENEELKNENERLKDQIEKMDRKISVLRQDVQRLQNGGGK